jgi:hypothetical protein
MQKQLLHSSLPCEGLTKYCDYGEEVPEMLRDRLVCSVNHPGITRKLLAETFEKAFTCAQSIEASERDSNNFKWKQWQIQRGFHHFH